jgi:hypothetical protein
MSHRPTGIVVVGDPERKGRDPGYGYGYATDAASESSSTADRSALRLDPVDPPTVERGR